MAACSLQVWAADAVVIHRFPSDLLWKDLKRFRTSLDCATILCEPSGQVSKIIAFPYPDSCITGFLSEI